MTTEIDIQGEVRNASQQSVETEREIGDGMGYDGMG